MKHGHARTFFSLSLVAAAVETVAMVLLNNLTPFGLDWFILYAYLLLPYLVVSGAAFSAIQILQRRRHFPLPSEQPGSPERFLIAGTVCFFFFNIFSGLLALRYRETLPAGKGMILFSFAVVLLGLAILFGCAWLCRGHLASLMRKMRLGILRLSLLFASLALFFLYALTKEGNTVFTPPVPENPGETQLTNQRISPGPPIVLLGLDGLSLDTVQRLRAQGRVPNLTALLDEGSSGYLRTFMPALSPSLWTSMSTGKVPQKHGIRDFRTVDFAGIRPFPTSLNRVRFASVTSKLLFGSLLVAERIATSHHYTSGMRTAKSIWNILSEKGLRVGVVGWYVTWPAESVNGFMVADRAFLYPDDGRAIDPGLTFPEELFQEVRHFNIEPEDIAEDSLGWLARPRRQPGAASAEDLRRAIRKNIGTVRRTYARDKSTLEASLRLMETYGAPDLLMLYFRAVDSMNHLVFNQIRYVRDPAGESLYAIPDNYYEFIDDVVGRIRERLGEDTILMIVSDHGWSKENAHFYAPPGLIIMHGRHIRPGCRIEAASILDVTPTVLYLKGLPLARDMDGRPLLSCIDGTFLEDDALAYIPTYEYGIEAARRKPLDSLVDEEISEQIRALGYIE